MTLSETGRPDCRSTGRSTNPMHRSTGPVDRSQPRVGSLQSVDRAVPAVDRAVDRSCLCACCARRSTGPVDRAPATAGGRLGRLTGTPVPAAVSCFLLLLPSSFVDDFLDDPSTILVDFLDNILSLSNMKAFRWGQQQCTF